VYPSKHESNKLIQATRESVDIAFNFSPRAQKLQSPFEAVAESLESIERSEIYYSVN
jgi:hypothetical protein